MKLPLVMKEMITWIKGQFSAFVGGLVDLAVMIMLVELGGQHYLQGIILGGLVGAVVNFSINRYWTFKASSGVLSDQAMKFVAMVAGSIILKMSGTYLLTSWVMLDYKLARIITDAFVCFGFNYTLQRLWVFQASKNVKLSILLVLCTAINFNSLKAQESTHEIRANLLYPFADIAAVDYEYYSGSRISFGVSIAINVKQNSIYDYKQAITVFSRFYPGNTTGRGFFIESHLSLMRSHSPVTYTTLFFGPSVGYKHYFGDRIHAESLFGLGIHTKHWKGSELGTMFFPRMGLFLGSRL